MVKKRAIKKRTSRKERVRVMDKEMMAVLEKLVEGLDFLCGAQKMENVWEGGIHMTREKIAEVRMMMREMEKKVGKK